MKNSESSKKNIIKGGSKIVAIGIMGMLITTSVNAYAKTVSDESNAVKSSEEYQMIGINWDGTAHLNKDIYSNITSYNNIFTDSPIVHNKSDQGMYLVVVTRNIGTIVSNQYIAPRSSFTVKDIPFYAGMIDFKGKAESTSMMYEIHID